MTKIKAIRDNVVITRDIAETETEAGIILPEASQEKDKPHTGVVVAVGPGRPNDPIQIKEGDFVYFTKYAGSDIEVDGKEYLVLKESDILVSLST